MSQSGGYTVCATVGSPHQQTRLPDSEFRAEVIVLDPPTSLKPGAKATLTIKIKNLSSSVWFARELGMSPFQLSVGNHWVDDKGRIVIHDDGRSPLVRDLRPGEATETSMDVNAPTQPGDYQLEVDMLQEGVSWFGERG